MDHFYKSLKEIWKGIVEMPQFQDDMKSLANDYNDNLESYKFTKKTYMLMDTLELKNNIRLEEYKDKESIRFYLIDYSDKLEKLVAVMSGKDTTIHLNNIDKDLQCLIIGATVVTKEYQGKGYGKLLYINAINEYKTIVSDIYLTGETGYGSFNIWQSLSKKYYTYILKEENYGYNIKEISLVDKKLMGKKENRFVISKINLV